MKRFAVLLLCLSLTALFAACQKAAPEKRPKPEEASAGFSVNSVETSKPEERPKPEEGNTKPEEGNTKPEEGNTKPEEGNTKPEEGNTEPSIGSLDSFSFSLTWNCYGISSYDSKTGKLVKTTDATRPEDYVTTYQLTEEQKKQIYDWVEELQVTGYPDTYDPHDGGLMSEPPMTLILTVHTDTVQKTIRAANIAVTYEATNEKGRKFLEVCECIETLLTGTEEWKALPEYEFFYE